MYKFEIVADEHRKHPAEEITLPKRATQGACAYDFYSPCSHIIQPNESVMVWTDVKAHLRHGTMLMLNIRSSMGKHLVRLANVSGWVDEDYYGNPSNDGNIGLLLHNDGTQPFVIYRGDRIAQGMILPYLCMDDDDTTTERVGGFGSTNQ